MNVKNEAVIVLSGLTIEEKAKVLAEARSICQRWKIDLIHNIDLSKFEADNTYDEVNPTP